MSLVLNFIELFVVSESCSQMHCENNSTCEVNATGDAHCVCNPGYHGYYCQLGKLKYHTICATKTKRSNLY